MAEVITFEEKQIQSDVRDTEIEGDFLQVTTNAIIIIDTRKATKHN
jgi:hypothetical protein